MAMNTAVWHHSNTSAYISYSLACWASRLPVVRFPTPTLYPKHFAYVPKINKQLSGLTSDSSNHIYINRGLRKVWFTRVQCLCHFGWISLGILEKVLVCSFRTPCRFANHQNNELTLPLTLIIFIRKIDLLLSLNEQVSIVLHIQLKT